jgi:hypothetical protein
MILLSFYTTIVETRAIRAADLYERVVGRRPARTGGGGLAVVALLGWGPARRYRRVRDRHLPSGGSSRETGARRGAVDVVARHHGTAGRDTC